MAPAVLPTHAVEASGQATGNPRRVALLCRGLIAIPRPHTADDEEPARVRRPGQLLDRTGGAEASVGVIQIEERRRSASSSVALTTNATRRPSGDRAGDVAVRRRKASSGRKRRLAIFTPPPSPSLFPRRRPADRWQIYTFLADASERVCGELRYSTISAPGNCRA
jgi:hypothetical protein